MGRISQRADEGAIMAIERKATDALIPMDAACAEAGIDYSTWWRWRKSGDAPLKNFIKLKDAVDRLIAA